MELDLTYALGEIQDIRSELETNLDPLAERIEGIEARLAEVRSALALAGLLPAEPFYAFDAED